MIISAFRILREVFSRKLRSRARLDADVQKQVEIAKSILGLQDFVAIDIGAANGLLPHWESLDGVACIYQIDPRAHACRDLKTTNESRRHRDLYKVVQTALSEQGGPATLYVTNAPTGSSLLPFKYSETSDCRDYIDQTYLHPIVEETIETETLAALMSRLGRPRVDMIKLDVQGTELPILRGFGDTNCRSLLGVELEIGLHDFHPVEYGLDSILGYMRNIGLELFDVRVARVHRPYRNDHSYYQRQVFSVHANSPSVSARIWEFDAIFFRRKSLLLASGDIGALRRMIIVYCTYNYFSEAYGLAEKAEAVGLFAAKEAEALKLLILELHRRKNFRVWLADTPEMDRWRRLFYRISPRSAPRWCQYMYQDYPNG